MNGTDIITILSKGSEKLSSVVNSVTGALITAIFLRGNIKATEFEKIKAEQFKQVTEDLLASGNMTYVEYYKTNNFLTIAKKADQYYSDHSRSGIERNYDFDWFVRFFEAVGNVSNDYVQNLWAKILAGEIEQPSMFSLKTIDVMRNLSQKDAELFVKVCSHSFMSSIENYFLPVENSFLHDAEIQYIDVMRLSELGLIFNDGSISLELEITNIPRAFIFNTGLIMLISSSTEKTEKASIGQYPFTIAGNELAAIVAKHGSDEEFLNYGRYLSNGENYRISVHKIMRRDEENVEYDKTDLLKT